MENQQDLEKEKLKAELEYYRNLQKNPNVNVRHSGGFSNGCLTGIGCLISPIVLLIIVIIILYLIGENVSNKESISNDTEIIYEDSVSVAEENTPMTQTRSFSELMKSVNWNKSKYGDFMVPNFFTEGESVSVENDLYSVDRYYYGNVEICCGWLGSWALDDSYPAEGDELSKGIFIESITYHSKKKNIYSGYVNDGRIYYMKMVYHFTDWGDGYGHTDVLFLVSIYPKEYKEAVTPIVNMIKNWN